MKPLRYIRSESYKKSSLKTILAFKNGVKNIQTMGYNNACMVDIYELGVVYCGQFWIPIHLAYYSTGA